MSDLVNMLKKSNRYSLVAINPYTDLDVQMPIESFLAIFNEMPAEQKEAVEKLIYLLKTHSIETPQNIKVVFRDDGDYMNKLAVDGVFTTNVPFKASSFPDFQKELKYTNIILIPKHKKIVYFGGIVDKDVFDTIIAPETEFKLVKKLDEFTTVWEVGNQPFYGGLNDASADLEKDFKYWFDKANDIINQGKFEESLEYFDKAIELNPTESLLWYMKGRVLIELDKCDEAIEHLDKAFDLNPLYIKCLATKGIAYEKLGKYDEAMACYDEAMILDPNDSYAFALKGTLYLIGFKDYDNALKYLNQAKLINPNDSMLWNNLGDIYLNKKEFEKGLKCCKKARLLDSNNFRAWFTTGEIYYELGKYDKSLEYAMKAKELNPTDSDLLNFIDKVKKVKSK
jgi:tetratricopeptide (TPR) repeat protein